MTTAQLIANRKVADLFTRKAVATALLVEEKEAAIEPIVALSSKPVRMGKRSVFVISFLAFAAINFFLSFADPIDFDPFRFIYRGWAWWTVNDLKQDKEQHNVALLGSSLMVSAVSGCDANFLQKSMDMTQYHRANYLDSLLHTAYGGKFNTFNLSGPGQMPSDAYLMLQAMVNTSQRPDVVIYGVAPRDFIDSTLSSPTDTEPFRYLKRIVNTDDVASGLYRSPIPHLDWYLQKHIYLYGHSLDLQMANSDLLNYITANTIPKPLTSHPFTWWDRRKLLPNYLGGEIIPSSMMACPVTREDASKQFVDNTDEYRERYKRPEPFIYKTQFYFLRKLAAYCRHEKIDLILVSMPLTQLNINLLKSQTYVNYLRALEEFAFDQGIFEVNMNDQSRFDVTDFHDSVHLNAFGGKKFFDRLVAVLQGFPAPSAALQSAGTELIRRESLISSSKGGIK